jgi:hypothetical protein
MNGQRYYAYARNNVRFFALDSNLMDQKQLAWLDAELKNAKEDWKICYFHHPLYSNAARHGAAVDLRVLLEPIFIRHGVNVVFSGHDHVYERVKPQKGITTSCREPASAARRQHGTRSRTGDLLPFKKGGFIMAIGAQTPVVPVAISGGRAAMRKGSPIVRPVKVTNEPRRIRRWRFSFPHLSRFALEHLLLLPLGAAVALVWANTAAESYRLTYAIAFAVNDVAMVFFFALMTKEVVEATAPGACCIRRGARGCGDRLGRRDGGAGADLSLRSTRCSKSRCCRSPGRWRLRRTSRSTTSSRGSSSPASGDSAAAAPRDRVRRARLSRARAVQPGAGPASAPRRLTVAVAMILAFGLRRGAPGASGRKSSWAGVSWYGLYSAVYIRRSRSCRSCRSCRTPRAIQASSSTRVRTRAMH